MHQKDKQRIIERYNKRLEKFGTSINALAAGTEERRNLRFKILTEIGMQNGDTILDLGCGFGDYARYIDSCELSVDYTGYDINPRLIEKAQSLYPGKKFETKDILNESFGSFDYIVSSSCFNLILEQEDNYNFVERLLRTCYEHARIGVAIDFNSSYVDFLSKEGFHYEPEKIFGIAKRITKRVTLRHDYPLFEFNIYLYKDFEGWGKQSHNIK